MIVACSPHAPGAPRPRWEVADVFRKYGEAYRHAQRLPLSHLEVMHAIEVCRTESLGGHVERCDACGFERHAYNSCRNRHCPKCQALAKAAWLEARKADLLDVGYFHVVFTLPHALNPIALRNKKTVYDLLFRAAADTLQTFAAAPRNGLGGKIGFTAVLHTWDQQLRDHVHLHCLVPAGALAPDRSRWIHARNGFLFPVKALSKVFRGKFIASLRQAHRGARLRFPGKTASLAAPAAFGQLLNARWKKPWVVYAKPPFGGPETVLDYLGRYTHRVAILPQPSPWFQRTLFLRQIARLRSSHADTSTPSRTPALAPPNPAITPADSIPIAHPHRIPTRGFVQRDLIRNALALRIRPFTFWNSTRPGCRTLC